ncbi:hypothetical protein BSKO_03577 [Bryopsis sp. KO-2023]|nr:hypothetical protein BSKO_03577 [Bryopsis sp. KO-2023]
MTVCQYPDLVMTLVDRQLYLGYDLLRSASFRQFEVSQPHAFEFEIRAGLVSCRVDSSGTEKRNSPPVRMTPSCVVEARGGTASASSGSDVLEHDDHACRGTATSKRRGERSKSDDPVSTQIKTVLTTKIKELEEGEAAEREATKVRRKTLREVQKYISSKDKSIQDKMQFLHNKFIHQVAEQGRLERELAILQKQSDRMSVEKEAHAAAQQCLKISNKKIEVLEDLCRSLKRQGHDVLEEAEQKAQEEANHRKALSEKMEAAVKDVTKKLDQQTTKYVEENTMLRERLESVLKFCEELDQRYKEQLVERDETIERLHKEFENQVCVSAERGTRAELMAEQCTVLQSSRAELQKELDIYKQKFEEFQTSIDSSNELFAKFQAEMKGSKNLQSVLQATNEELKKKCKRSDLKVMSLLEELKVSKSQNEELTRRLDESVPSSEHKKLKMQKEKLEGLCRALQTEVRLYRREEGGATSRAFFPEDPPNCD